MADRGTLQANKWVVWGIHFKVVSGSPRIVDFSGNGTNKISNIHWRTGEWVCTFGYAQTLTSVPATYNGIRIINDTGGLPVVVRIADMFAVEFDTESEAIAFCNSSSIPK